MSAILDPNLAPELRAAVGYCSEAVPVALAKLRHDESDAQAIALAIYSTVIELFSSCVGLAAFGEPTAVPIILRSMYESHVDLDNLLQDAGYVEHIHAAGYQQTLKIMEAAPLRQLMKEGRKAEYDELNAKLADLKCRGKGPPQIYQRYKRAGRLDEYEGLYALFCIDAHNNSPALAERAISERPEGACWFPSSVSTIRGPSFAASTLGWGFFSDRRATCTVRSGCRRPKSTNSLRGSNG
jgi:hypothetical protein